MEGYTYSINLGLGLFLFVILPCFLCYRLGFLRGRNGLDE